MSSLITSRYISRVLSRNPLWWITILITVGLLIYFLYPRTWMHSWYRVGLDSSLPYLSSHYLLILQSFFLIFIVTEYIHSSSKADTAQVLWVYPPSNIAFLKNLYWGLLKPILLFHFLALTIVACIQWITPLLTFNGTYYLFYFITLTVPTLFFLLSLSLFILLGIRNKMLALLLQCSSWLFAWFFLEKPLFGVLDPWARALPNMFSSVTGHSAWQPYLCQRLFLVFCGMGLFYLSLLFLPRLPNRTDYKKTIWRRVFAMGTLGIITMSCFLSPFYRSTRHRENYREVYEKYATLPAVTVKSCDIEYRQKASGFQGKSSMIVQNEHDCSIEDWLLYLNPYLKVEKVSEEDKSLLFERENQAIVIHRHLKPGESIRVEMEYEGKIDGNICYLDIPDKVFFDAEENSISAKKYYQRSEKMIPHCGTQYLGRELAYCDDHFTFLYPECLWYPVSVAPINLRKPLDRPSDYSDYRLKVAVRDTEKEILSQGHNRLEEEFMIFENNQPLPGISLCIGDYKKRSMVMDSITVELFYLPSSAFILDQYQGLLTHKELFEQTMEKIKGDATIQLTSPYPFHKYALAELPIQLTRFKRKGNPSDQFVQPEFSFIPERAAGLPHYRPPFFLHKSLDPTHKLSLAQLLYKYDGGWVVDLFRDYGQLNHQVIDFSGHYSSDRFPGIDYLMHELTYTESIDRFLDYVDSEDDLLPRKYLKEQSFLTNLTNNQLPDRIHRSIISDKITHLMNLISSKVSWPEFRAYARNYKQDRLFSVIDFDLFLHDVKQALGLDLETILNRWYNECGSPAFHIKDLDYAYADESKQQIKIAFKVYNSGETEGLLSIWFQIAGQMEENSRTLVKSYTIKEQEALQIMFTVSRASAMTIYSNLADNIPRNSKRFSFDQLWLHPRFATDTLTGIFPIERSYFFNSAEEIILDNEDDNFRLFREGYFNGLLANYRYNKELPVNSFTHEHNYWRKTYEHGFYGNIKKGALIKTAGRGKCKVEWNTTLFRNGLYELFYYSTAINNNFYSNYGPGARIYYSIIGETDSYEVEVNADEIQEGWVSLGRFPFREDEQVRIILNDKGGRDFTTEASKNLKPKQQLIVADAVKFQLIEKF